MADQAAIDAKTKEVEAQGMVVRDLKAAKADKAALAPEIEKLLRFVAMQRDATNARAPTTSLPSFADLPALRTAKWTHSTWSA